jgi:XTP/dITP diphosphohydrolase
VPLRPRLLIATNNPGKLEELTELLAGSPYAPVSLADLGIGEEVAETGATFEENATLKAKSYARMGATLTLADDSGLEVAALGGEPGVRSARYAGEGANDSQRIAYLLDKLDNVDEADRSARFRCVIALASPGGEARLYSGECRGRILRSPRGENGFGYDPVFLHESLGKTMAELTQKEKNSVSHRSVAVRKAVIALRQMASKSGPNPS